MTSTSTFSFREGRSHRAGWSGSIHFQTLEQPKLCHQDCVLWQGACDAPLQDWGGAHVWHWRVRIMTLLSFHRILCIPIILLPTNCFIRVLIKEMLIAPLFVVMENVTVIDEWCWSILNC